MIYDKLKATYSIILMALVDSNFPSKVKVKSLWQKSLPWVDLVSGTDDKVDGKSIVNSVDMFLTVALVKYISFYNVIYVNVS